VHLTLTQIGNSVGVILPKEVLARLNARKGDKLFLTETPDGYALTQYDAEVEEQIKSAEKGMARYRNTLRLLADS